MAEPPSGREDEPVLLLHGLLLGRPFMWPLARALGRRGFRVLNVGYPSTRGDVATLAAGHLAPAVASCLAHGARRVHAVTHSLGGIVLRWYLRESGLPPGSRAVMLCPPNHGAEVVDTLAGYKLFRALAGAAACQLGTAPGSLSPALGPARVETGVIAGDRSINPLFSRLTPAPNDGPVSVASTRLEGMRDFLVVHRSHTAMLADREVIDQAIHFLEHGHFRHPAPATARRAQSPASSGRSRN